MLHDILLQPDQAVTMAKHGRHVNVVLASGVLRAIVRDVSGNTFETNLIAGMAFVNKEAFESVTFISETAQQTQIWIGDLPLNYSPDSIRSVGAGSLSSTVAEAYSGGAQILLPAVVGRNKVTLYSQSNNILIGGPNVNIENGIPLVPGEAFSLEMQGAVYALETTGNYPAFVTAKTTYNDFINATELTHTSSNKFLLAETTDGQRIITKSTGVQSLAEVRSKSDYSLIANINVSSAIGASMHSNYAVADGEYVYIACNGGGYPVIAQIDLTTMACTQLGVNGPLTGAGSTESYQQFDKKGDKIAIVDVGNNQLVTSNDNGATWKLNGVIPPYGGTGWALGVAIAPSGRVYIAYLDDIYYTDDGGDTWTQIIGGVQRETERGIAVDSDGAVYVVRSIDNTLEKSVDSGIGWEVAVNFEANSTFSGWARSVMAYGNTVFAASYTGYAFYSPNDGWWAYTLPATLNNCRGGVIGTQGTLYAQYDFGKHIKVIEGEQVPSGGVKIAVMAEVN